MKANRLACAFLLLLAANLKLTAHETKVSVHVQTPDGSRIRAVGEMEVLSQLMRLMGTSETNTNQISAKAFALAENGDPSAQVVLGFSYFMGLGFETNRPEAVKWFRKAADQSNLNAENNLGACYANGFGVEKDLAEAAKWFRRAAEKDCTDAQYWLGRAYESGKGVDANITEAEKWYRKAAEDAKTPHEAAQMWFRKAASEGDAEAQCFVGYLFHEGKIGVKKESEDNPLLKKESEDNPLLSQTEYHENPIEAAKWYRRAAEQGNSTGQNNLGVAYRSGDGVPMDYVEAYRWLNLAAGQGGFANTVATLMRDELAKKMTPYQIGEAQRLAREFIPRKEIRRVSSEVSVTPDNPTASGSGFFITDDGYLITNEHVVKDAAQVRLVTSAGLISAKVVKVDAANDLALLKAEGRFASLPIAASRAMRLGSTVATVGFPNIGLQGFAPKFARGEIASLSGAGDDARYFQISVPVQPGNSGGALVDERGNVVGVVSAKLNAAAALASSGSLPENVNYAVKSSYLLSFLEVFADGQLKLKEANGKEIKFEEVVEKAKQAAVLVLVY